MHLATGGFSESGGAASLSAANRSDDVGYSTLGLRLATDYILPNHMTLTPRMAMSWQRAFGDITPGAVLAFQGGTAFGVTGVPLARNAALLETGFDLHVTAQAVVGVAYVGRLADTAHDHAVRGNLSIRF